MFVILAATCLELKDSQSLLGGHTAATATIRCPADYMAHQSDHNAVTLITLSDHQIRSLSHGTQSSRALFWRLLSCNTASDASSHS